MNKDLFWGTIMFGLFLQLAGFFLITLAKPSATWSFGYSVVLFVISLFTLVFAAVFFAAAFPKRG